MIKPPEHVDIDPVQEQAVIHPTGYRTSRGVTVEVRVTGYFKVGAKVYEFNRVVRMPAKAVQRRGE